MRMSKKVKKVVCSLALVGCLLGKSAIAYADTTYFTLTVTRSGANQDNLSKRTRKAGGSAYENKFYVTPTGYAGSGIITVESIQLHNSSVFSYPIPIKTDASSRTHSESYRTYATPGKYYYLEGIFGHSNPSSTLNLRGRYTP